MNHPKVAVIIPVFNGLKFTKKCLPGLYELINTAGKSKEQVPIVVVDDGSSDGTHQWISEHYPEVHLLQGDGGLWWSGGVNMGMHYALEKLAVDYVLWWNNDIIPRKDYLSQLFNILSKVSDQVVVGSKVFVFNDDLIWGMGGRFDPVSGLRYMYGERQRDDVQYQQAFGVDWLPGMGTTLHRSVVETIGYLDQENFPQYHADSDYSLRAKSAGFQIMAFPELVLFNDITNTGLFHENSYSRLFHSLTSIKSIYGFKRDLRFLQTHSTSYRAYLPFVKKYYKYIGGFFKWKILNALGVKKNK